MPTASSPTNDNPLLRDQDRIPFDELRADHVAPGLRSALTEAEATFARVRAATPPYRWDDLLGAIDRT